MKITNKKRGEKIAPYQERKVMKKFNERIKEEIESEYIAYHYSTDEMIESLEDLKEYITTSLEGLYRDKREWEEINNTTEKC